MSLKIKPERIKLFSNYLNESQGGGKKAKNIKTI